MNVGELKKLLEQYPDDMEILYCMHSDYRMMDPEDIGPVKAVNKEFYHMRSHPTMSDANKANERTYLLFPGN